jgi:hypothetical protein
MLPPQGAKGHVGSDTKHSTNGTWGLVRSTDQPKVPAMKYVAASRLFDEIVEAQATRVGDGYPSRGHIDRNAFGAAKAEKWPSLFLLYYPVVSLYLPCIP